MSSVRNKMIDAMKVRRFSLRTQESYLGVVNALEKYYNLPPDQIDPEKMQAYLLHLTERGMAWSTCNVAVSAYRFLHAEVLGRDRANLFIPPRKKPTKLPVVLSREEIERLFACAHPQRNRFLLMTTYAAGLRVSETVSLKVTDIDSNRMTIRVEQAKGAKDRYSILSPSLLDELRSYWKLYKPPTWLFPASRDPNRQMDITTAQKIYYSAKERAGITHGQGIHTLRHCFATHLLEAGIDLRTIQSLMGHSSITTTMRYLQIRSQMLDSKQNRLDLLAVPQITEQP